MRLARTAAIDLLRFPDQWDGSVRAFRSTLHHSTLSTQNLSVEAATLNIDFNSVGLQRLIMMQVA